ncbi:aldose epimerase family protein [Phaeobacter gallaeciensis]|uniref:Aldose 1-epimerase n=1 Tax=Phaeobacter gallaeciensis TaxID=60890 RepID=A0AAC9ZCK5_9RHOB|nr:aldose epimerase family protein [Phaeobacter gallaeciensis]AHD11471.1 aldose 1-epimerase [Phaeobacter gallaeciensis DSM 26640]ATE94735.1 aldose 1-epimerase [Phaeobacter gallaeciensis]ATE99007.1 aldose 1-epimerase [Phaeobacter gallaeciensis]ATF03399.1 aldose 1-epimerase [Phaeobacter gallaeciensis]ATF07779.1 aldose 1-epimerase [Phaeobacter gallaeciensis]
MPPARLSSTGAPPPHTHLPETASDQLRWLDLEDDHLRLRILNFGAITARLDLRTDDGWVPMVLGYRDIAAYLWDPFYLGAIVGRVANRIGGARFDLAGRLIALDANEGGNQLHGGAAGLGRVFWDLQQVTDDVVELSYTSVEGENGYPGCAEFLLRITVSGTSVSYDMRASVDKMTPINLAQHNYYTLGTKGDIWGHRLRCPAAAHLPLRPDGVPTGAIAPVAGTPFDFTDGQSFAKLDPQRRGTDTHVIFSKGADSHMPEVATLTAPNGVAMRVCSDQPGAQIYTATHLNSAVAAQDGQQLAPFAAVCIEPQGFPDAVNQPDFPSVMVHPGRPYHQKLLLDFSTNEADQDD